MLRKCLGAVLLALIIAGAAGHGVQSAPSATPAQVIEGFHNSLLAVMRGADELKVRGRYDKLAPEIEGAFNLPFMMQVAAGTKWREASDEEKSKLVEAFTRVSVGTYASRFDGFSGERFEVVREQDGPGGSRLVVTRIVRPNKDPVPITYVMRKFGEEWRIYDVIVSGGISELAVRRSEYNAILNSSGPRALINRLNQKADEMLAP